MHKILVLAVLVFVDLMATAKSFGCEDHKEVKTKSQKTKSVTVPTEDSAKKVDTKKADSVEEFSDAVNRNAEIVAGAAVDAAVRIKNQMNPQSKEAE